MWYNKGKCMWKGMKISNGTSNHTSGLTCVDGRGQGTHENGEASVGAPTLVDYLQCPGGASEGRRDCPAYGSLRHHGASGYRQVQSFRTSSHRAVSQRRTPS